MANRLENNVFVGYNITNDCQKKALLLSYAGNDLNDIVDSLPSAELLLGKGETHFNKLTNAITNHFNPQINTEFQRYTFRKLTQKSDQIDDFYHAETCNFGDRISEKIKSQLIAGCKFHKIREKGLSTPNMTLADLLKHGRTIEVTQKHSKESRNSTNRTDFSKDISRRKYYRHVIRAETAVTALNNADEKVSDSLLIAMILKGLPASFKPIIVVTTQSDQQQSFIKFNSALGDYRATEKSKDKPVDSSVMKYPLLAVGGGDIDEAYSKDAAIITSLSELEAIVHKIEIIDDIIAESQSEEESITDYEYLFTNKAKLTSFKNRHFDNGRVVPNSNIETSTASQSNLPMHRLLDLEEYNGDPLKWQAFWDGFCHSVYNVESIPPIRKFTYLRRYLKGEAAAAIEGNGDSIICEISTPYRPVIPTTLQKLITELFYKLGHFGFCKTANIISTRSQREGENIDEYVTELKMMTPEVRALVLDGNCVIVPVSMRRYMLELIHMSHLGIVKCKRRARELVYWPGMQAQIEDTVSKCSICQANRNMPNKELLKSHEIPYNCWSKVGTDLCTFGGKNYVICIDYFSKFLEYVQLSDETSESVIKAIQLIFSRQGIPKIVMSDNGPCYNSSLFKKFAGEWGFVHKTSSPRHSQSNGQVENGIKTFKKLLKKSGGNHTKFQLALLEFRTSPIDGISKSPSQLLNGRRFKTLLPITESLLKPIHSSPDDHPQLLNRQKRQKYYFGRNRHNLKPLNVNDNLRFRIDNKWVPGTVTQKVDDRSYKMESRNGEIRRNRCQINKSQEEIIVEPNVEIDLNADECVESEQGCESNVKDSKKVTRSDCGYTDPDEMVRDRIAFGTNAAKVREKLINEGSSLTLNKAIEIARVYKILREQLNFMSDKVTDFNSKEVNAVRTTRKIIQEENTRSCVNVGDIVGRSSILKKQTVCLCFIGGQTAGWNEMKLGMSNP
ncbi:hypothetical protein GQR58_001873 [Nymphon striatum]|nr:hypothetical protein GQR58_001873 [Nymphon striatum]